MTGKIAIIYSNNYKKYYFGPDHPLRPQRLELALRLMESIGILNDPNVTLVEPQMCEEEELELVHSPEYIEMVKYFSKTGEGYLDYGDTPAFPGMFEVTRNIVGGSLKAADLINTGKVQHAFNIGGGLHHATKSRGSGFCVFNDIACTIRYIQRKYHLKRVMIVDFDCHHADGTQDAFYSESSVLTVSLHEDGTYLFPGSGFVFEMGEGEGKGYCVNIPLPPHTFDEAYIYAFNEIVPPLVRAYQPEILLQQSGVDTHYTDPLTSEALTINSYVKVFGTMHKLAHEVCDGKYLMFGGGGYQMDVVARAWTSMLYEILNLPIPKETPETWRELYENISRKIGLNAHAPIHMGDPEVMTDERMKKKIFEEVKQVVREVKERIFPIHGIEL
ncbi:MAG: acetoin utilization protein AcuC [Candidatus Freyarchaeota archaeon]|nr:acetoin utilization protein AcuC [Candidatus Jordarchaeia archaeon]MBS7269365.1 acetoin utilization protein AcuC [Candidatus Jordarchaeia archaeon]MBS7278288.1 acetoin utilization protein AcuC [Candidatus Jordarchaeia archaeon]